MNSVLISLAILLVAALLRPRKIYLLWGAVLIIYAAWPAELYSADDRLAFNLPFEYVPLLSILASGAASGLMRNGSLAGKFPKWLYLSAAGIIFYGLISVLWVRDYTSWFQYLAMWSTYIVLLFLMICSLSKESSWSLSWMLDRLLAFLGGFLLIVIIRNLMVPTSHFGTEEFAFWDFSPLIRYRISQVISVLPFVPVATMLYFTFKKLSYLLFAGAATLAILASFSRDGMVGLVVSFLLCTILSTLDSHKRPSIRRGGTIAVMLVLALGGAAAVYLGRSDFVARVLSITSIGDIWGGTINPNEQLWGRMIILQQAVGVFLERPFLGTGMGNYLEFLGQVPEELAMSPHNLYVTYLSEFGIIGFIPLISFLIGVTHFLWKKSREAVELHSRAILQGFVVSQVTFFVLFFATDFLVTPYVWFFWGLALTFGLAIKSEKKAHEPRATRMAIIPHLSVLPSGNR